MSKIKTGVEGIFGISLLASLFFLSSSITGNVVGNFSKFSFNFLGIFLFFASLVGLLFHLKLHKS